MHASSNTLPFQSKPTLLRERPQRHNAATDPSSCTSFFFSLSHVKSFTMYGPLAEGAIWIFFLVDAMIED